MFKLLSAKDFSTLQIYAFSPISPHFGDSKSSTFKQKPPPQHCFGNL